ncbi:hypothetical protein BpHYR1_036083 [Brachionus plicatilis]|uniref:Uncharacterized protein n=1 Tax=Brachionus plicatilis TaxID=10195 RepID=A0A3M7R995_BRAPC|nr:hypothetical protein BpHYR1_036083 [Brachionus plicatilis]
MPLLLNDFFLFTHTRKESNRIFMSHYLFKYLDILTEVIKEIKIVNPMIQGNYDNHLKYPSFIYDISESSKWQSHLFSPHDCNMIKICINYISASSSICKKD